MWLMKEFADAKQQQADFAEAERLFHESLALTESIPQDAARINWISNLTCCLSDCLVKQGKTSEAEQMYQKVVVPGDRDWHLRQVQAVEAGRRSRSGMNQLQLPCFTLGENRLTQPPLPKTRD